MALAVDTTSNGATTGTTVTVSHTGGSPDLAVAGVVYAHQTASITVTYGGVSMTAIAGGERLLASSWRVKTFYLVNPPSGTQNVVATVGTSGNKGLATITFTGANTGTPIANVVTQTVTSAAASNLTVTTAVGDIAVFFDHNSGAGGALTPNTGDTEFMDRNASGGRGGATYQAATTTSTTVGTSTGSATDNHASVAFAVQALRDILPSALDASVAVGSGTVVFRDQYIVMAALDASNTPGSGTIVVLANQVVVATALDVSSTPGNATVVQAIEAAALDASSTPSSPAVEQPIMPPALDASSTPGTATVQPGNVDLVATALDASGGQGSATVLPGGVNIVALAKDSDGEQGFPLILGGAVTYADVGYRQPR